MYTFWHRRISYSVAIRGSLYNTKRMPMSGTFKSKRRHWRIRASTSAKSTRSRKSNYQWCSKWQVRMENVREKTFLVTFKEDGRRGKKFFLPSLFKLSTSIWSNKIRLIKFLCQFQFLKFCKSESSHLPIAIMVKVSEHKKVFFEIEWDALANDYQLSRETKRVCKEFARSLLNLFDK